MQILIVRGIFSIIKGLLKPNLLPNIKDFQIIFVDLCSISSFSKLITPQDMGKNQQKSFSLSTNIEMRLWFRFPIPKPSFGHTLTETLRPGSLSRIQIALYSSDKAIAVLHFVAKVYHISFRQRYFSHVSSYQETVQNLWLARNL